MVSDRVLLGARILVGLVDLALRLLEALLGRALVAPDDLKDRHAEDGKQNQSADHWPRPHSGKLMFVFGTEVNTTVPPVNPVGGVVPGA